MALVVEDGSGANPAANSFGSESFIRNYNAARGRVVSDDDDMLGGQAIQAMDYIHSLEPNMKGYRSFIDQPLCFPRTGVYINGILLADDIVPVQIANGQAELVYQVGSGVVLMPSFTSPQLKRRKTGPLEREWFQGGAGNVSMPWVDTWLGMFLINPNPTSSRMLLRV